VHYGVIRMDFNIVDAPENKVWRGRCVREKQLQRRGNRH